MHAKRSNPHPEGTTNRTKLVGHSISHEAKHAK